MADFNEQRTGLNKTRDALESARLDELGARARLKLLERQRAELGRRNNPDDQSWQAEVQSLDAAISRMKEKQAANKNRLDDLYIESGNLFTNFEMLTDPRVQLPLHFSNKTPFLLFPVRMETRFKTVIDRRTGGQLSQLWVRIYPDTCMVDSFDPQLSDQELRNAARFWAEYYAAGDVLDENDSNDPALVRQKAAWAFIANLEGAGRAAWITQSASAKPLPGSVFPKRDSTQTIILTIATEDLSIQANKAAIFSFFKTLWLAGKDQVKIDAAKTMIPDADDIIDKFLPVNFYEPLPNGLKRSDADLQIALVLLPDSLDATGKTNSWSQAARVAIAPERFMLLGFKGKNIVIEELGELVPYPLQVGFDPNNSEANNFAPTASGDLEIPAELKWITDFEEAILKGMAFRVNLNDQTVNGVDRLFAIGLKLSADESEEGAQKLLTELFDHHYSSSKGISIVPQGTPTNNTDKDSVPSAGIDNSDLTFDRYFRQKNVFTASNDWQKKQDGQWLSEWLGLDPNYFQKLINAEGLDQADGLNMNIALWPGTMGYAMDAMMQPVFGPTTARMTQEFFTKFVAGHGTVPSIRIGNQPYGILPVTAFDRQLWLRPLRQVTDVIGNTRISRNNIFASGFINSLYTLLKKISADWRTTLVPKVAHVSAEKPGGSHQQLLDIIGLHPNSVEFYKRYLQSLDMLYSYASFLFPHNNVVEGFDKMEYGKGFQLLQDLGYKPTEAQMAELPLLSKLYGLENNWEHKVIIDTVPLSETTPLRSYTADNKNYITAVLENASKSMDALRKGEGLTEQPAALLYSFIKFALEQGYYDTAIRLHEMAALITPQQSLLRRKEQPYLHMKLEDTMVESRYAMLYKNESVISSTKTVGDHISQLVSNRPALRAVSPELLEQVDALKHLDSASTARLERAFVEHLDCCSYRLDAWEQGITKLQLTLMRNVHHDESDALHQVAQGIYLGAFGWLENVRPDEKKILTPVTPGEDIKEDFTESYVSDQSNAGFIHAPSVNQAVTAAVLRNAFLTNGKIAGNNELAVNLSSERIRQALSLIEGIQNGQSLAALLGYKFERILRDQDNLVNKGIDTFIYALRKLFPLNADKIVETRVDHDPSVDPDTIPITAVEAKNVVHGQHLVQHVRKQTGINKNYPYGFPAVKLPPGDSVIATAITSSVNAIMNMEDAIADLGMAESVHQICLGNYDRAAGVLDSYSKGSYPQTPDVIRTPRSGPTLTHRVGLQFDFVATVPLDLLQPRKTAEPSLDSWLASILPPMTDIVAYASFIDRTDNADKSVSVTMAQLGLAPIDLLYLLNNTGQAALGELDERMVYYINKNQTPRLDLDLTLGYISRPADATKLAVFEIMSMVASLRALILPSAPLKPTDMLMPGEASISAPLTVELDRARVDTLIAALDALLDGDFTANVLDLLNPLAPEPNPAEAEAIIQQVDAYIAVLADHLDRLARFGLPQTGVGGMFQTRRQILSALYKKLEEAIIHLEKKQAEYDALELTYDPLATNANEQLQILEATITTLYSDLATINLPAIQVKKSGFDLKLQSLRDLRDPAITTGIVPLLSGLRAALADIANFTSEVFAIGETETHIVRFVLDEIRPAAQGMLTIGKKITKDAADALTGVEALEPVARVRQIESAARVILGQEFRLLPRYIFDDQQQTELQNSWSADLLKYLREDHVPAFFDAKEDWLHGVARVREKMHHAENVVLLREALFADSDQLSIHPVQLPYKTEDYHWLAMPFPPTLKLEESDILLYTALVPAAAGSPQYACGLLLDEWTEVIPLENETTGLSFNYDRPSTEAPQTMLLVTPTTLEGNWQWMDIVDAMHHALDSAKLRGVEPHHIDQTTYARYLPPLVSPVMRHPITISMYLADLNLKPATS